MRCIMKREHPVRCRVGVSYLLERDCDLALPRRMQVEFSAVVQRHADSSGSEVTASDMWRMFEDEYLNARGVIEYTGHKNPNIVTASIEAIFSGVNRVWTRLPEPQRAALFDPAERRQHA